MSKEAPDRRIADIARAGRIRVGLFPPLYTVDLTTGQTGAAGVEGTYLVEIARALAIQIGADVELIRYPTPAEAIDGLRRGGCDLSFFGIDPLRSDQADFSPPFVRADFTYLVRAGSPFRAISDVDQSHIRVAAVRNHASTKAVSAKIRYAQLIYGDTPEATFDLLRVNRAHMAYDHGFAALKPKPNGGRKHQNMTVELWPNRSEFFVARARP